MRLIQLRVLDDHQESVLGVLDDMGADYVIADEAAGNDASIVYFPLPSGAVEEVLDQLRENGLAEDAFTIISKVETATTPKFDELEGRYTQGPDEKIGLSHAELRTKARELTPGTPMFIVFAALSAIVAAAGLLLNSAIVIVGAMVISPFAGSSLAAGVGAVIGDYDSIIESFRSQLIGLTIAICGAIAAGLVFRWGYLVPPALVIENISVVSSFATPTPLALTIAIFAGTAGALALATDLPVAIAGVAVAAAIVPAAATVGLGIVWLQPLLALGALVLLLANVVFINITAYTALWLLGYRSTTEGNLVENIRFDYRTAVYAITTVAVCCLLVVLFASMYQYFLFGQTVSHNVSEVITQPEYTQLELVSVHVDYGGGAFFGASKSGSVTVVVAQYSDRNYPDLSEKIQNHIAEDTEKAVTVSVRFVEYQQTSPTSSSVSHDTRRTKIAGRASAV